MGNFNKYNNRSLSQLLQESAAILAEDEFPPAGASTEPPPAAGSDMPPVEDDMAPGPPGEEGEPGAEDTPEGIVNQISDLLDQLRSKLGIGGGEEEIGGEEGVSPSGLSDEPMSAPATPPPVESRRRPAPAKKPALAVAKK